MNRFRFEQAWRILRSYRYLDPVLQPMYRRWHKSLELDGHLPARKALSCHLSTIFWECIRSRPSTIVEIGVRDGESTEIFCRAAQHYGGTVISVDTEQTDFVSGYPRWHFFQEKSQELGARFSHVREDLELGPIDLIFLDSSHLYTETRDELEVWLPHLDRMGVLMCHDTAMSSTYRACDGTLRRGWDNARGVTRALEEVLEIEIDERKNFLTIQGEWVINHTPLSSGLTMVTRLG